MFTTVLKHISRYSKNGEKDCKGRYYRLGRDDYPQLVLVRKRTTENPVILPRKVDIIPIKSISKRLVVLQKEVSNSVEYSIRNNFGVNMGKRKGDHEFRVYLDTDLNWFFDEENDDED